mmetsp:Transcript_104649/g.180376  ORF Transcript_104649/g.180376 Transcript_104649/m.180376 type:complete len:154 (+) Transcript_104649:48-509(+)
MSATAAAQAQVAAQAQKVKEAAGAVAGKPAKNTTLTLTDGTDTNLLTKKLTDQSQDARTVIVFNVSPKASEDNLSAFFGYCGKLKDIRQQYDRAKDQFCWLIEFERAEMARTACMLHGTTLLGTELTITSKGHSDRHYSGHREGSQVVASIRP